MFLSATTTVLSLISFATFQFLLVNQVGDELAQSIFKWSILVCACMLVFAVQLGVQTLPLLLSGELFPSDVRPACKSIARSFQCILLAVCLLVSKKTFVVGLLASSNHDFVSALSGIAELRFRYLWNILLVWFNYTDCHAHNIYGTARNKRC